jgi:hypothetical protein
MEDDGGRTWIPGYVTKKTPRDPAIADHDIPDSLCPSAKPSFWKDLPWPPIGPDR